MTITTSPVDAQESDYIILKWGTLKGWRINNPEAFDLLKKYGECGVSISAMTQRDTPEQKQMLCDLIRHHDGTIYLDWDGKFVTKEEAISYIEGYR